jgi:hypothetical protein
MSDKAGGSSILTPDGYNKTAAMIHIGPGCSQGCLLLMGGPATRDLFLQTLKNMLAEDTADGKGDTIKVVIQPRNSRECASDTH